VVVTVATATLLAGASAASAQEWLRETNRWRSTIGAPAVREDATRSAGAWEAARYMVQSGEITHSLSTTGTGYTAAAADAAKNSVLWWSPSANTTDSQAIETWVRAPFHGAMVLHPRLATAGYGSYRDPASTTRFQFGAAMDVRDIGGRATSLATFPGHGSVIPVGAYGGGEHPNPMTSCPGYQTRMYLEPVGLPLLVFGPTAPGVSKVTLTDHQGYRYATCTISGSSYVNPDPELQRQIRATLATRGYEVVVPKRPLPAGWYRWSFSGGGRARTVEFGVQPRTFAAAGTRSAFPLDGAATRLRRADEERLTDALRSLRGTRATTEVVQLTRHARLLAQRRAGLGIDDVGFARPEELLTGSHGAVRAVSFRASSAADAASKLDVADLTGAGAELVGIGVSRASDATWYVSVLATSGSPSGLGPFADVASSHTHAGEIGEAALTGVTHGCSVDRFCPSVGVRRDQAASLLARQLGTPLSAYEGRFRDVPASSPHARAIEALARAGVVQGCATGRFCPGGALRRAQAAALLARARGLPLAPVTGRFVDVPADHGLGREIEALAATGVTSGCTVDRFCPSATTTRAQFTSLLVRSAR
jgi:hypothetical protein